MFAVFSDIHSNYHAFLACFEDAKSQGADSFIFLGDYVTDLASPLETLDLVYEIQSHYPTLCLRGNRERYMLEQADGISSFLKGSKTGSLLFTYEKLHYNGYFLHEKSAPIGFLKDDGYYYFEIRVNGEMITVENEAGVGFINQAIKGNIELTKVDAENTDTKLNGAVFKIYADTNANGEYDAEDEFVTELIDNEGIYRAEGIRYGNYFCIEESAPVGFVADTKAYYFEIRIDGETIVIANTEDGLFTNKPITGELEITKTDIADGKPLANVGFRIKDADGNIVIEGYTDENGIAKFTLRYGKYTYTEFECLDGYYANTEEYPFEIKEDGQIIKAAMTNEKIPVPEIPQTGDNSNIGFWIGLAAVALGGLVATVIIGIKRKKDDEED